MAVTLTAQALADESGATLERATRVLAVAVAVVEEYAPAAPVALKNEAVLRFGGYLLGSDYGGVRSESIGPRQVEYITNSATMFRNSGAAALLTRYRVRHGGVI